MPPRARQSTAWNDAIPSRDEQFALKRSALVRQAARAFNARGYYNTSLEDVAHALGVTKPALYYYVKSKEEILFECHQIAIELGDKALAFARECEGCGFVKVIALGRRYLELLTSELGAFAVLTEFDALTPASRKVIAGKRNKFDRAFRALVAAGIEDGSIRAVDSKLTVFFFMGAVNWMTRWFDTAGPLTGQQIADQFTDLLAEAIRAR